MNKFNIKDFNDYLPLRSALEKSLYIVFQEENIDKEKFIKYMHEAEASNSIIIFYNINFTEINLYGLEFYIPIIFYKCKFEKALKFTNCHFFYQIFFHSITFDCSAKFKLSIFYNGISFINSVFKSETSFERVKFLPTSLKYIKREILNLEINFPTLFYIRNTIDFLGISFLGDVSFINSNFGCSALFASYKDQETAFYKNADFSCLIEEVEILNIANDKNSEVKYSKEIEIPLDKFHRIFFHEIKFYGEVNFENRVFQKKTSFTNSIFHRAPKFHNCDIHQDTDFRGVDFIDTYSEGAEQAYRSLKLIMDKKKARREEGMFFALEQKSLLNAPIRTYDIKLINNIRIAIDRFIVKVISLPQTSNSYYKNSTYNSGFCVSLTEKILSFCYLALSNYGQSIKRPILILLALLFGVFPILYKNILSKTNFISKSWGSAYHLSLQQFFRPFEIYTAKFMLQFNDLPFSLILLATMQGMINVGLLTMFILAIRNRFKMY
ncbi:MAG: pentapeptide repeat-containing protein [Alphaproteobacteria bacterium]